MTASRRSVSTGAALAALLGLTAEYTRLAVFCGESHQDLGKSALQVFQGILRSNTDDCASVAAPAGLSIAAAGPRLVPLVGLGQGPERCRLGPLVRLWLGQRAGVPVTSRRVLLVARTGGDGPRPPLGELSSVRSHGGKPGRVRRRAVRPVDGQLPPPSLHRPQLCLFPDSPHLDSRHLWLPPRRRLPPRRQHAGPLLLWGSSWRRHRGVAPRGHVHGLLSSGRVAPQPRVGLQRRRQGRLLGRRRLHDLLRGSQPNGHHLRDARARPSARLCHGLPGPRAHASLRP